MAPTHLFDLPSDHGVVLWKMCHCHLHVKHLFGYLKGRYKQEDGPSSPGVKVHIWKRVKILMKVDEHFQTVSTVTSTFSPYLLGILLKNRAAVIDIGN